jgi:GH15 family glucan-1,4-alpha-glucosidase
MTAALSVIPGPRADAGARPAGRRDAAGYLPIADYAFLSDCRSAALVSSAGSVDWLCWPRFDSEAVFARILDGRSGGSWSIRPDGPFESERRYVPHTNVLETTFRTASGTVRLTDWLHVGARQALCRRLEGIAGSVAMRVVCDPRPGFNASGPVSWSERGAWLAADLASGDRLVADGLSGPSEAFTVHAGESRGFSLSLNRPGPSDLASSLKRTVGFWRTWAQNLQLPEERAELVERSALTLKGLQYEPSGAIVAAATTSLPESVGGARNWDYRFSWIRDATLTLGALAELGKGEEAQSWLDWLGGIALTSDVDDLQVMYGVGGETELDERELAWLDGYRGSRPVRVGNGAAKQRQIDTYGELAEAIWMVRTRFDERLSRHRWRLMYALAERALHEWREPDEGIWEVRGGRRDFVYSKVMCWVALDRAIRLAELDGIDEPSVPRWRRGRDEIRREVLARGFDEELGSFTQSYGSRSLDAANLTLAGVGFLDPHDRRFVGTVRAIERGLMRGGFVDRYRADTTDDGLDDGEGTFTMCTLWLCLALLQIGDVCAAREVFDRVCARANDLGLLSEQLTPDGEQLGNYPQAFTHVAVIHCAAALAGAEAAALAA